MIPIQCPQCGRTGNVPPDRLNARLVCKGCHSAFHMDAGGRMVLGEPGDPNSPKGKKRRASAPAVEIDFAQTWRDFPKPAKYGVPAAVVLLAGWMLFPSLSSGVAYQDQAEVVGRALLSSDRSKVVALATTDTAEAAGQWYDRVHGPIAEKGTSSVASDAVRAALLNGNPERDSSLSLAISITTDTVKTNFNLQMTKQDGQWKLDGTRSLVEAEQAAPPVKLAKKR